MSSSAGYSPTRRPGTAYADRMAARKRRERVMAAGLGVIFVLLLVYEVPKFIHTGAKNAAPPAATATTPSRARTAAASTAARELARLLRGAAVDTFSAPATPVSAPAVRDVRAPAGSIDPFAVAEQPRTATPPPSTTSPLPEQIVIGTPGGGRVATHGWIVILASIPTAQGEGSATTFAKKARKSPLGTVSILNSSNRKPLRGGYWVVYTGPYSTLTTVSAAASQIHTLGYPTAYIRELLVYH